MFLVIKIFFSVGHVKTKQFDRRRSSVSVKSNRIQRQLTDPEEASDVDFKSARRKDRSQSFASIKFYSDIDATIHKQVFFLFHENFIV